MFDNMFGRLDILLFLKNIRPALIKMFKEYLSLLKIIFCKNIQNYNININK